MGVYGSPELHPNITGASKHEINTKKRQKHHIICPHCGELIPVKPKFGPLQILKYSLCILLSVIVLGLAAIIVSSLVQTLLQS